MTLKTIASNDTLPTPIVYGHDYDDDTTAAETIDTTMAPKKKSKPRSLNNDLIETRDISSSVIPTVIARMHDTDTLLRFIVPSWYDQGGRTTGANGAIGAHYHFYNMQWQPSGGYYNGMHHSYGGGHYSKHSYRLFVKEVSATSVVCTVVRSSCTQLMFQVDPTQDIRIDLMPNNNNGRATIVATFPGKAKLRVTSAVGMGILSAGLMPLFALRGRNMVERQAQRGRAQVWEYLTAGTE